MSCGHARDLFTNPCTQQYGWLKRLRNSAVSAETELPRARTCITQGSFGFPCLRSKFPARGVVRRATQQRAARRRAGEEACGRGGGRRYVLRQRRPAGGLTTGRWRAARAATRHHSQQRVSRKARSRVCSSVRRSTREGRETGAQGVHNVSMQAARGRLPAACTNDIPPKRLKRSSPLICLPPPTARRFAILSHSSTEYPSIGTSLAITPSTPDFEPCREPSDTLCAQHHAFPPVPCSQSTD